ncbi:MAG: hypothetical protein KC619_05955 [Myxococcales bacterium]|nr:hypothetical protein [Myxococcales bacterium]
MHEIVDPRPRRALNRAHASLERELRALLRPERADVILEEAFERVIAEAPADPAQRLRALVGARLLDETADLLARVAERMRVDETPTVTMPLDGVAPPPVRLETGIDERADRTRIRRRWTPEHALARRVVG